MGRWKDTKLTKMVNVNAAMAALDTAIWNYYIARSSGWFG